MHGPNWRADIPPLRHESQKRAHTRPNLTSRKVTSGRRRFIIFLEGCAKINIKCAWPNPCGMCVGRTSMPMRVRTRGRDPKDSAIGHPTPKLYHPPRHWKKNSYASRLTQAAKVCKRHRFYCLESAAHLFWCGFRIVWPPHPGDIDYQRSHIGTNLSPGLMQQPYIALWRIRSNVWWFGWWCWRVSDWTMCWSSRIWACASCCERPLSNLADRATRWRCNKTIKTRFWSTRLHLAFDARPRPCFRP